MAGTNVALSAGLIEGMQRLGFRISRADEEALLHMWRYSGYLSGIDPELAISTPEEGRLIGELVRDAESPPDSDSRALLEALMCAAYHPLLEGKKWPAKLSYGLSRRLIGDGLADALGYPPSWWAPAVIATWPLFAFASVAQRAIPGARGLATRLGGFIWDRMIEQTMANAQAEFHPPTRLAKLPVLETKA
jgi:hypothetical protein